MARLDNLDYEVNGGTVNYEIVPEIAPLFNATTAYAAGDQVIHEGIRCKFTTAHPAGAWIGTDVEEMPTVAEELTSHGADITELKADLSQLDETAAKIDGSYDTMTVGNAKQLTSNVGINDKAPYLHRTAGGATDIGDREEDTIVGGSVIWNQLVNDNGATYTAVAGGSNYFNLRSGIQFCAGHKYFARIEQLDDFTTASRNTLAYNAGAWVYMNTNQNNHQNKGWMEWIFSPSSVTSTNGIIQIWCQNPSNDVRFTKAQFTDLTAMFGAAIADYIYTLESTTAGAGIAWLRKYGFFTKDYYPYLEPTFKHVEGLVAHKMVVFNQLVTPTEYISQTQTLDKTKATRLIAGQFYEYNFDSIGSATTWRTAIKAWDMSGNMLTKKEEFVSSGLPWMSFYSNNNVFLDGSDGIIKSYKFVPLVDCYVMFYFGLGNTSQSMTVTNPCLHLIWDGERDGEYEPYKEYNYPLDSDVILRGNPKLDANNDLYYDGDRYLPDGTVERWYELLDVSTIDWQAISDLNDGSGKFVYKTSVFPYSVGIDDSKCNTRVRKPNNTQWELMTYGQYQTSTTLIITVPTTVTSVEEAKQYFIDNPTYILYKKQTPTEETADPFQSPQIVDDWGTEEYVYADGAFPIPVGHNTFYATNLKAKVEMSPDSPGDGDGDYIVRQTNGLNEYVKLVKELPSAPTTDGSYHLEVTVASGTPTLTWVADE